MLKITYYNFLCQLPKTLFFSQYIKGITVLYVLVFVLASHICTLGYLLGLLPNKASLLVLLFLSLKVLLLCFLSLLGLFKAFGLLPPMALIMLQFRLLFPVLAFAFLTPMHFSNIGLASVVLWQMVLQCFFVLYFSPFLPFAGLLCVSFLFLYRPGPWPGAIFLLLFPPILPKCFFYFGVVGLFFCRAP